MDVSVIVVNYNTKGLLEKCLFSIYKFTEQIDFEVIVVDNNSKDGSVNMVKKEFPKVHLIVNKENLGFAKANNQGIKVARGRSVFLLNSDAYFIENSIKKLIDRVRPYYNPIANKTEAKSDIRDGPYVISPMILNEDKSIQQSVGFFPHLPQIFYWMSFLDDLPAGQFLKPYHIDHDSFYKKDHEVDWATGAALFVPKEIIKKSGPLDSGIFMYGEDVEWCWRIKKSGFKILYTNSTKIIHLGSGSSGKVSKNPYIGEYLGLLYFYKKYKGNVSLQIVRLFLKIGALGRIFIFGLLKGKDFAKIYVEAFKVV